MTKNRSLKEKRKRSSLPRLIGESLTFVNSNAASYALVGKSLHCRRTYVSRLNQVARLFGFTSYLDTPWNLLRHEHVDYVVRHLHERELAPSSINTTLSALRAVCQEAFNLGQLGGDDLTRIVRIKPGGRSHSPLVRKITTREIKALVKVCDKQQDASGLRDIAIIGLLYVCGLRRTEITLLNVGDFSVPDKSLVVQAGKKSKRLCWPDEGTSNALTDWLDARSSNTLQKSTPLFTPVRKNGHIAVRRMSDQAVYNAIHKRCQQAGLTAYTPSDFRRTFVTNMLENDVGVELVQQLAGHAHAATTLRYDQRRKKNLKRVTEPLRLPYSNTGSAL